VIAFSINFTHLQVKMWIANAPEDLLLFRPAVVEEKYEEELGSYAHRVSEYTATRFLRTSAAQSVESVAVRNVLYLAHNTLLLIYQSREQLKLMKR
jgi:hypothetical protein